MTTAAENLYLMSNLPPAFTGLPFVVWISPRGSARHDCRVKVSMGPRARPRDFVSVAVRPRVRAIPPGELSAEHLDLLTRWIERNRDVLVRFWSGDIEYTPDVLAQLVPLEGNKC
jgi:hypothetical protein